MSRFLAGFVALAFAAAKHDAAADAKSVAVDAKEVALPEVVKLLTAQGAPTVTVHPDLAEQKVTFAAKAMPSASALRWLCRSQNLVVFEGKDNRLVLARPDAEPVTEKEYNVVKLLVAETTADAIVAFTKKVIFVAHPMRSKGDDGALRPALDAVCEKGKLKVAGTALVQREVLALLRAVSKVQPKRAMEDIRVPYHPYEIGFLGSGNAATGPKLVGEVTLDVAGVSPAEAAWALTSAAKVSFYVDPWDSGLNGVKVSLKAENRPVIEVAKEFATQLGAERTWHDEAWLFVREDRRPLFDGFLARAYNIAGVGGIRKSILRAAREVVKGGQQVAPKDMPYSVEQSDDLVLVSGPADWHTGAEDFVKKGPDIERFLPRGKKFR
jgi:hypothetical protein